MRRPFPSTRSVALPSAGLLALVLAPQARAQQTTVSFSVDWQGVLQGQQSSGGTPFTAADVLVPFTGKPTFDAEKPFLRFTGGFLGITAYTGCVGSGPGVPCVELDALSFGKDARIPSAPGTLYRVWFSTDEYAIGQPLPPPSVASEAPIGDACADVFVARGLPNLPVPPQVTPDHFGAIDGNGLPSASGTLYPGLGITEPNVPGSGFPNFPFDPGDNVDALDVGSVPDPSTSRIWFSLDGDLFDPFSQTSGTGSAQTQGVRPGDVLVRLPSGQVNVYAPAAQLGLDRSGTFTDDLDTLILGENGVPGYQPSATPYDWETSGTDMLFFSVRRGSAVIGAVDSLQGLPIMPGDLLGPPVAGGNGNPSIMIAAEALGLQTTRSGGASSDEMNAGDLEFEPYYDCNKNNVEDAEDIADGSSEDKNFNGIPDECERPGTPFCFCPTGGVCGTNDDSDSGCRNSTGQGANLTGHGSSSVFLDDLVLVSSRMRPNQFGLTFMGPSTGSAFMGAGIRCVAPGSAGLFRFPPSPTGSAGTFQLGPGIVGYSKSSFPPQAAITVGSTWYYQSWYRDPNGPCGQSSNVTNALEVLFTD